MISRYEEVIKAFILITTACYNKLLTIKKQNQLIIKRNFYEITE